LRKDSLFDDENKKGKQFKKETRSGGYSDGQKKPYSQDLSLDLAQLNQTFGEP
jgi:hypothetical protein